MSSLCDSVFVWLVWLFLFFLNAIRIEAGKKPVLRTSKDKERSEILKGDLGRYDSGTWLLLRLGLQGGCVL